MNRGPGDTIISVSRVNLGTERSNEIGDAVTRATSEK